MLNKQHDKKIQSDEEFTNQINDEKKKQKSKDFKDDDDIVYLLQKQIQEQTENEKEEVHKERLVNLVRWENNQKYLIFFENISIFRCGLLDIFKGQQQYQITILRLQQQLKKNNFILMKTKEKENLNYLQRQCKILIRIKNKSKNYEVVQIMCSLGRYTREYTILNQTQQSHRHKNKVIGIGSFGSVFLRKDNKNQSVVKCLRFTPQNINQLKNHIKQYFLYDMMSALQIGPKILRNNGFDFILFNDCMQFQMEKCQHKVYEEIQTQLKQGLAKMHLLSIVHSDIKPANIMYSKQFKRNVFLDFGTSEIVKEAIGQKSLIKFRGTYQFCRQQMKRLFLSQKIQKVDLYFNDIEMLKNSLYSKKIMCADSINLLKNDINYQKNKNMFNHSKQLQFSFKHHLYVNQNDKQLTNLFLQFLSEFQYDTNYKQNIQSLISAIKFTSQLEELALVHLKKHRIWKIPKYQPIQYLMNETQFFQNKQNIDFEQKQSISFLKLYSLLAKKVEQQGNQQQDKHLVYLQNKFQNIEKPEKTIDREIDLTFHQTYTQFIEACSFCKSKFKYSIQKKQMIAQLIMNIIDQDKQNAEFSSIVKDQYLPISQFANMKCKNLILAYQYLLNYCFESILAQFKFKNTIVILKDCIILGFQYFYFIQEYMIQYFSKLVICRFQELIVFMIKISIQLIQLSEYNFIFTKQKEPLYQKKHFKLCLKNIIIKLVKFFDQNVSQKQPYYSKRKSLQNLWESFFFSQIQLQYNSILKNQIQTNVTIVFNQIQNEISLKTISVYEKANQFCINAQRQLLKINNIPQIAYYYCIPDQSKVSKKTNLILFDSQVNCRQLSKMFFIDERIKFYQQTFNFDYIFQVWDLILQYECCPSINYKILAEPTLTFNTLGFQKHPIQFYKKIVQKLSNFNGSLLEIFSQNKYQNFKIKVLLGLKDLYFRHGNFLIEQKPIIYQKLNILKKSHQQQSLVYLIIETIQLQLFPKQSIEFIQKLKQFFQSYLKMFKKYKNKEMHNIQASFFNSILFQHHFFDNDLQYWKNQRIKIILRKSQPLNHQFQILYYYFFLTNNSKHLIEILCFYCKQISSRVNYSFYTMMNKTILQLIPSKRLKNQLYIDFLQNLQIIKKHNPYPIYLIPIYIYILGFLKQLDTDFIQWEKLLIQVINLNEKIPKNLQNVYQNIQAIAYKFPEQLHLLSLQYFQKKVQLSHNQNRQFKIQYNRKYRILLRKLLKNKINSKFLYQKQIEQYIQKLEQIYNKIQAIHFFYQNNSKARTIKKLFFLKFSKYKQNCLHNITFNNYQQNVWNNQLQGFQQDQQKRILFKILQNSKQKMMRFEQIYNQCRIQFLTKYQIKNIKIFQQKDIFDFYEWTILKKQFLNISQEEYCSRIKSMENQIQKIKKTAGYKLSEQTVDIIDQIFNLQRQNLLKELKQTKNMELKDIQDKWIEQFI